MAYCEKLTKQMLKDWGFTRVTYLPDFNIHHEDPKDDWYIERTWRKNSSKAFTPKKINITDAVCKHKYTEDKKYWKLTFMCNQKAKSITFARFIYVWYIGDLEEGEVVDHIDNNPYNNHPSNLQKLSVGENLAKRNADNYRYARNQYEVEFDQFAKKLLSFNVSREDSLKLFDEFYNLKHGRK